MRGVSILGNLIYASPRKREPRLQHSEQKQPTFVYSRSMQLAKREHPTINQLTHDMQVVYIDNHMNTQP